MKKINTLQAFILDIIGADRIFQNHKNTIEEIIKGSNQNGNFFASEIKALKAEIEQLKKGSELLYNSYKELSEKVDSFGKSSPETKAKKLSTKKK